MTSRPTTLPEQPNPRDELSPIAPSTSRLRPALRANAHWLIPILALVAFMSRMALRDEGLMPDWSNNLWLVWEQGRSFGAGHGPTLFFHAIGIGSFYPQFAYYGGTLFSLTGGLSWLLRDHAVVAYLLSWAGAFAMAYGGTTWISLQSGLRGWRAQVPGFFLVTSAYFITNAYGRGAWGEFVAVAAMPMVAASAVRLLRGPWTPLPLVAFIGSFLVFTGSHNVTLLWGSSFLVLISVALLWARNTRPTRSEIRRSMRLALLAALVVGANFWFLLPDLAYSSRTLFATARADFYYSIHRLTDDFDIVFHPLRRPVGGNHPTSQRIYLQVPVVAVAWIVAALVGSRRVLGTFKRRAMVAIPLVILPYLILIVAEAPWDVLPRELRYVQFSYRLHSYVVFGIVGLSIVALLGIQRLGADRQRWLVASLVGVLAFASVLGVWQVWHPGKTHEGDILHIGSRRQVFASPDAYPPSWYDPGVYRDYGEDVRVIDPPRKRFLHIGPTDPESFDRTVDPPDGPAPINTDIGTGTNFVDVTGVVPVGRNTEGFMVVRRPAAHPTGPVHVTVTRASSFPIEAGRWISVLSTVALVGIVCWSVVRRRRRRQRSGSER